LARVLDKRKAKKAAVEDAVPVKDDGKASKSDGSGLGGDKAKRSYRQRQAVDREGMKEKGMEGVLSNVFG